MKRAVAPLLCSILVAAAQASEAPAPGGLSLSLEDAIAMALARNESIVIQRESLVAADSATVRARGAYDPALDLTADYRRATEPSNSSFSGAPGDKAAPTFKTSEALLGLRQLLPTGGSVALQMDASRQTTDSEFVLLTPSYETRIGVEVRQPLLRGRSIDTARLGMRVAAADRALSAASLRRQVTETVAAVEDGYWSLVSAQRAVEVREEAVRLADEQLSQTRARVEEGAAPQTEVSQPLSELERRRGELYASRETASRSENVLKRLILDASEPATWASSILPADDPNTEVGLVPQADVEASLARALAQRPEMSESQAVIERRRVESAFARDILRPGLDAFVSYDRLGLAGSVADQDPNGPFMETVPDWIEGGLGRSFATIGEGRFDDTRAGVVLSVPIGNRFAKGEVGIARAAERQAEAGMAGIRKRVLSEVLDASAAVDTAAQRVEAARAARDAAEVQLTSERDRYDVGLSTNFLVLTRQNDLSRARLDEIAALTDYRKARTEMARATGSLLDERRIQVEEPVNESGSKSGSR
ncbi:MAG TPA: TolC family protein [Candidatus Polarisedimenticolia bacterium]|nr:TolC family protein [Candidatus Polarisedimenticolia bacterium]